MSTEDQNSKLWPKNHSSEIEELGRNDTRMNLIAGNINLINANIAF